MCHCRHPADCPTSLSSAVACHQAFQFVSLRVLPQLRSCEIYCLSLCLSCRTHIQLLLAHCTVNVRTNSRRCRLDNNSHKIQCPPKQKFASLRVYPRQWQAFNREAPLTTCVHDGMYPKMTLNNVSIKNFSSRYGASPAAGTAFDSCATQFPALHSNTTHTAQLENCERPARSSAYHECAKATLTIWSAAEAPESAAASKPGLRNEQKSPA